MGRREAELDRFFEREPEPAYDARCARWNVATDAALAARAGAEQALVAALHAYTGEHWESAAVAIGGRMYAVTAFDSGATPPWRAAAFDPADVR